MRSLIKVVLVVVLALAGTTTFAKCRGGLLAKIFAPRNCVPVVCDNNEEELIEAPAQVRYYRSGGCGSNYVYRTYGGSPSRPQVQNETETPTRNSVDRPFSLPPRDQQDWSGVERRPIPQE